MFEGRRSLEKRAELPLEGGIKVTDVQFRAEKRETELIRDGLIIEGELHISIYYLSQDGAEMFAEHKEAFNLLIPIDGDIDCENSGVDVEISPSCAGCVIREGGKVELNLLIEAFFKLVRRTELLLPLEDWVSEEIDEARDTVPLLCDRVVEKRIIDLAVTLKKIIRIRKESISDIDIGITRLDIQRGKRSILLSGELLFTLFYRDESGSGRSAEMKDEFDILVNTGEDIPGSCSFLFKPSEIRAVISEDGGRRSGIRISAVGSIEAILYREELFRMQI